MADNILTRKNRDIDITLHTATALATTLDMRDVAGAVVSLGTMSTNAASLQMWVGTSTAGTFRRLYKSDGSVADLTLAASSTDGRDDLQVLGSEDFVRQRVRPAIRARGR